jgi:hypothetical protein
MLRTPSPSLFHESFYQSIALSTVPNSVATRKTCNFLQKNAAGKAKTIDS